MTQFVLECPEELIDFVTNNYTILCVKIKHINLEVLSIIANNTPLSKVLITIIDSYVADIIIMQIIKEIIEEPYFNDSKRSHTHFSFIMNNSIINFDTYSFRFMCCIKFECQINCFLQNNGYESSLYIAYIGTYSEYVFTNQTNDVLNYKIFKHRRSKDRGYEDRCKLFETVIKKFNECCVKFNGCVEYSNCHCYNAPNFNLIFNHYSQNAQQNYNLIEHDANINKCENVTYDIKSDCYNHTHVSRNQINLRQYKIMNHKKFTTIIAINKLLFDVINKQSKYIHDFHIKTRTFQ